jgi:hypothetical protein
MEGDVVVVHADPSKTGVRPGLYFVRKQLPAQAGEPCYAIRSALESQDRVVEEGWVRLADKW